MPALDARRQRAVAIGLLHLETSRRRYARTRQYIRPYSPPIDYDRSPWSLDDWSDDKCKKYTRFSKQQIDRLVELFDLEIVQYRNRLKIEARDALAILLHKLAAPSYLWQNQDTFHCSAGRISVIVTDLVLYLSARYEKMLRWHPILNNIE